MRMYMLDKSVEASEFAILGRFDAEFGHQKQS